MRKTFKRFLVETIKELVYYSKIKQEEWYPNNWIEKFNCKDLIIIYRKNIYPCLSNEETEKFLRFCYKRGK